MPSHYLSFQGDGPVITFTFTNTRIHRSTQMLKTKTLLSNFKYTFRHGSAALNWIFPIGQEKLLLFLLFPFFQVVCLRVNDRNKTQTSPSHSKSRVYSILPSVYRKDAWVIWKLPTIPQTLIWDKNMKKLKETLPGVYLIYNKTGSQDFKITFTFVFVLGSSLSFASSA